MRKGLEAKIKKTAVIIANDVELCNEFQTRFGWLIIPVAKDIEDYLMSVGESEEGVCERVLSNVGAENPEELLKTTPKSNG